MKAIIFDADGTLCFVGHRLHHIEKDPKDWVSFHDEMVNDTPIEAVTWLARMMSLAQQEMLGLSLKEEDHFAILIVSARHEPYRTISETWFAKHDVSYDKLYMRADDDRRPDHEVKEDILQQIVDDGYEPILAIDDRPEVCDMWRRYGLTVLQCAYQDTASRQAGKTLMTLLVGPAGAGKSTFATKTYKPGEIISTDRIREQEGLGHTQDDLALTFKLARGYAKARIDAGLRAVIDATNLKKKDRAAFVRLAPRDTVIEYVLLDRDYDQKVKDRGWRPEELIGKHHRMFRDTTLADVKGADGFPNVVVIDRREKK